MSVPLSNIISPKIKISARTRATKAFHFPYYGNSGLKEPRDRTSVSIPSVLFNHAARYRVQRCKLRGVNIRALRSLMMTGVRLQQELIRVEWSEPDIGDHAIGPLRSGSRRNVSSTFCPFPVCPNASGMTFVCYWHRQRKHLKSGRVEPHRRNHFCRAYGRVAISRKWY